MVEERVKGVGVVVVIVWRIDRRLGRDRVWGGGRVVNGEVEECERDLRERRGRGRGGKWGW